MPPYPYLRTIQMGRPQKEIDPEQFEALCEIQCTLPEIASVLRCSEKTIERWTQRTYKMSFVDAYKKFSANGKTSLRRYQFELAKKNASMAIFLGKQYLGQRDQPEADEPEALERARELLGGIDSAID